MKNILHYITIIMIIFSCTIIGQEFSITLDGEKDAWYNTLSGPSDGFVALPSASYLRDVGTAPEGDDDLSALVWFAWDEDFLYCYLEVMDDVVTASNAERFLNDCIEIKFDPDPDEGEGTGTANLRLTAHGEETAEQSTGVDNLNGSGHLVDINGEKLVVVEFDYGRKFIDGGYALEFRVPFDYINEPEDSRLMVERIENNIFGMAINIGDNDSGTRDHMLQWSAGHTDAAHSQAVQLGTVTFLPNHKLSLEAVSPRDPSIVNVNADEWYIPPTTEFSITLDGEKDAWYNTLSGPSDGFVALPSASYLRDVGTAPEGDDDLSALVWFAWDEDFLYCYLEVMDDVVTASNAERFLNDCIEIKFDPDPDEGEGTGTANLRLTAHGEETAEQSTGVDNLNGSGHLVDINGNKLVVVEFDYGRRFIDGGYALEFRVPFDYINEPEDSRLMVERIENNIFGMAINIGDNDSGTRDHMLQWSAGHTDAAHSQAVQLGTVTFLPNHKLSLEAVSPRDPSIVNVNADEWYVPNITDVEDDIDLPLNYSLNQNYPNPFNPATKISYTIKNSGNVRLSVFDALGRLVEVLVNKEQSAGIYEVDYKSNNLSGGVYFYQLQSADQLITKKMMLLK